jgi:hypothetical protein
MADKKISALTDRPSGSITGDEEFATQVGGTNNFKISLTNLKDWIITQLTTFATLAGIQTLTNKRLTFPKLNSDTQITVESSHVNFLTGLTQNVENALDDFESRITTLENGDTSINHLSFPHVYALEFTTGSGVTTKIITQSNILDSLGLSTSVYVIDYSTVSVSLYQKPSTYYRSLVLEAGGINLDMTTQTISSQIQLGEIQLTGLTGEKTYLVNAIFKIQYKSAT